jgi:hypothetical protein
LEEARQNETAQVEKTNGGARVGGKVVQMKMKAEAEAEAEAE